MGYSEAERKKLINKLKTVKDARERDRIIWALAGHEEKAFDDKNQAFQPGRQHLKKAPEKQPDLQSLSKAAADAKRLITFAVPGFFLIFGIAYLVQAILGYLATRQIETEASRLITGGLFVFFGLAGLLKAAREQRSRYNQTGSNGMASG